MPTGPGTVAPAGWLAGWTVAPPAGSAPIRQVWEDRIGEDPIGGARVTRRGLVLFGLMSVIWGLPYFFIRIAVAEITPATLVFARTSVAALILLPIALAQVDLRAVLRRWRWVVAFAAVEIAGPWVLLGSAEQHISSSLAGLLVAGVPLVGSAIALATGDTDRLGRTALVGLLVGLAGVVAIVGGDFQASDVTSLLAIGIVVVGYAIGPAILSRRLAGLPAVGVMALSLALCAVVYAPIAALQLPPALPSTNVLASIAILAIVCTAAAFLLFAALIDEVGPVRATVITYVNPAVAALLGVLVLQETFTVGMAIGFGLVILGSTLATRRSGTAEEPSRPPVAAGLVAPRSDEPAA
jgi:drug/metabolite transporter (DMT)-like permease